MKHKQNSSNAKDVLLSVIIPIYNTEKYLYECLESVKRAVSKINAEVLLIDDCSDDSSPEIASDYARNNNGFFYYRTEKHCKPSVARNYGVSLSKGYYIAFVDSDDIIMPGHYINMLSMAEQNDVDMVTCMMMRQNGEKYFPSLLQRVAFQSGKTFMNIRENPELVYDCTVTNKLIPRSLWTENNIHFPEGHLYEDGLPVLQAHYASQRTAVIQLFSYNWKVRPRSITQSGSSLTNITDRITMHKDLKAFFEKAVEPGICRMLDYKALREDFDTHLEKLHQLSDKEKDNALENLAAYTDEILTEELYNELPPFDQQKIHYLLKRDGEMIRRLFNYKKSNYSNAPVIQTEDSIKVVLNPVIFPDISGNADKMFLNRPFIVYIDNIEQQDEKTVKIEAHDYVRRVNVPDTSCQSLRVFLVNQTSGTEIPVDIELRSCPLLTKKRGHTINNDDYKDYYYDYNGTGFSFTIDLYDILHNDGLNGSNVFMIHCRNPIGEWTQILQGISSSNRKKANKINLSSSHGCVELKTDNCDALVLSKISHDITQISYRKNRLELTITDPLLTEKLILISDNGHIDFSYDKYSQQYYLDDISSLKKGTYLILTKTSYGKEVALGLKSQQKISKLFGHSICLQKSEKGTAELIIS